MSDRSSSPQGKENRQRQRGKKTTVEVKKPRDLPKAKKKKRKPMVSDEDDEVPQNEPGTSSNTQPPVPVLPPVRINIQFTRSIDHFDQFTKKNIDQHQF